MSFPLRLGLGMITMVVTLLLQVVAIEAVFFPPALPFRLDNEVPIIWRSEDNRIFSTADYHGTRLNPWDAEKVIEAVHRSMRCYPQWVLDKHLDRVILVDTLTRTNGRKVGGLASGRRIFLTARSALAGAFHHELAHVLRRAYGERVDVQEWQSINPPGFRYGHAVTCRPRQAEFGSAFVTGYAMTAMPEDFAETAEELFKNGYDSTFTASHNEILHRKALILVKFYRSIDPVFTEEYFRNLS